MDKKTAFVLGGGGARGAYEIGVWQALREMDIKIDMVAGCSVGAINGAIIAQDSFDLAVKLWKEIQTDMIVDVGFPKKKSGALKNLLGQYLDEKQIRNSGMDLGIVTTELPEFSTRYFYLDDIPKGKLIDYIVASASLFPAIKIADIDNIKYVDGGYLDNVPVGMALKKGATHIIAVDLETAGLVQKEPLKSAENLILIRCKWPLGEVMIFDGKNAAKNMRLGYLDTLKAFGFFDGNYYTFSKGGVNKKKLNKAETAARVFEVDPATLYTAQSFRSGIHKAVHSYKTETETDFLEIQGHLKKLSPNKEVLLTLLKKINSKTIALIMSDQLKNNPRVANSLLARPVAALFKDESLTAEYLVKEGII